jgi:hypothetical protein
MCPANGRRWTPRDWAKKLAPISKHDIEVVCPTRGCEARIRRESGAHVYDVRHVARIIMQMLRAPAVRSN